MLRTLVLLTRTRCDAISEILEMLDLVLMQRSTRTRTSILSPDAGILCADAFVLKTFALFL